MTMEDIMSSDAARQHISNAGTGVTVIASAVGVTQEGLASLPMLMGMLGIGLSCLINLDRILANTRIVIEAFSKVRKLRRAIRLRRREAANRIDNPAPPITEKD